MLRYRHYYGGEILPSELYERLLKLYERTLQEGFDYHKANLLPAIKKRRGRIANRPGHNLLIRLSNYREDVLRFLHAPEVPFTNNEAERDLRMMKCKQKISGGFRSTHGANQFARIRGFINTTRKQGLNILKAIQSIFSGDIMLTAGC
jgi:transposase